jgi:hypothetical protein
MNTNGSKPRAARAARRFSVATACDKNAFLLAVEGRNWNPAFMTLSTNLALSPIPVANEGEWPSTRNAGDHSRGN